MPRKTSAPTSSRTRRSEATPEAVTADLSAVRAKLAALAKKHPALVARAQQILSMNVRWECAASVREKTIAWRPKPVALVILGDLVVHGNVLVKTRAKHDDTFLLVLGSVTCNSLLVASQSTFLCVGNVTAREAIVCNAGDSVSIVGGRVAAKLLSSGRGAWLEVGDAKCIAAQHFDGYVMASGRPHRPSRRADLSELVVDAALDTEEWDSLEPEDRAESDRADMIGLDHHRLQTLVAKGAPVLR